METKVRILTLLFENKLTPDEIPLFRGAVIGSFPEPPDILFHNHREADKFRYAYPLIQYKRLEDRAALVGINEGCDALGRFGAGCNLHGRLGEKTVRLKIASVHPETCTIRTTATCRRYSIERWLQLNSLNYKRFKEQAGLAEQILMLEKILTGNLLSFLKGIRLHADTQIRCKILESDRPAGIRYKGVELIGFHAVFQTNL